jgi:hypothetical protein
MRGMDRRYPPRTNAWTAAFAAPDREPRPPFGMGHNQGPPLGGRGTLILWQKAHAAAWKAPVEVVRRRIKGAEAAGLTYHEYTLEILERGRWLAPEKDAARIAEIIAAR